MFKFQTTSFFLSVFFRRQLRMQTALNLIKAPLKKCQTRSLKYSASCKNARNQKRAGSNTIPSAKKLKIIHRPQIEAIFYQEVIREGTATVLVVRCCFASLRQLIAHVCRTGHQICKMPAQHERSFGEMLSKRAH